MKRPLVFSLFALPLACGALLAANADDAIQTDAPPAAAVDPAPLAAPAAASAPARGSAGRGRGAVAPAASASTNSSVKPTADQTAQIEAAMAKLEAAIKELKAAKAEDDLIADAEAPLWVVKTTLRHPEEIFTQGTITSMIGKLNDGLRRAEAIKAGNPGWINTKGTVLRAFHSVVDGTPQPYKVIIPASYDPAKPMPLYIYLHGRGDTDLGLGWVGGGNGGAGTNAAYIQLQVFGRANCSFRFPGETDVFEALAAVKRHYNIDPNRIILAGFSMGGAGSWSIGLHEPDLFCGLEIDAGVIGNKLSMDGLTPAQKGAAVTYGVMIPHALNVVDVPLVGYAGENDAQLAASKNMSAQLVREGYHMEVMNPLQSKGTDINTLWLATPRAGHSHATGETLQLINEFTAANIARGRVVPDQIRFVTYTTRYNRDFWITVDGLQQSFDQARVDANRDADKTAYTVKTQNVSRLIVNDLTQAKQITIDGDVLAGKGAPSVLFTRNSAGHWEVGNLSADAGLRKQHNLQGPINDAFFDSFLCVTPTGVAFNAIADERGQQELTRFADAFNKEYRGDTRTKTDAELTDADIANNNLVLFGDPGSNKFLAKIANKLPIKWTKESIVAGDKTYSAVDHVPVLIYPNPLNPKRYIVINTGLVGSGMGAGGGGGGAGYGDFAILQVTKQANGRITDRVAQDGLFDESWKLPANM